MSARALFLMVCAALVLAACGKGNAEPTEYQTRTMAKMLEAAERDGDAGAARSDASRDR